MISNNNTAELRHIVITGASSGIGAALALYYAKKYCSGLVLTLAGRNESRLQSVAELCRGSGAKTYFAAFDISDRHIANQWIKTINSICPIDLLIANAGISGGTGGDRHESPAQARRIFEVNFTGVINTVEPAIQLMRERGRGQIALMSSLAGYRGWPGAPAYCASKAAVKVYGESLRVTLKPAKIKVNVICPGFVKTPMTDSNSFPMPFIVSVEKAARIIARGLEKNRSKIAFPLPLVFIVWIFQIIPGALAEFILKGAPVKTEPLPAGGR
jgi:short-subunit dehydrogenase